MAVKERVNENENGNVKEKEKVKVKWKNALASLLPFSAVCPVSSESHLFPCHSAICAPPPPSPAAATRPGGPRLSLSLPSPFSCAGCSHRANAGCALPLFALFLPFALLSSPSLAQSAAESSPLAPGSTAASAAASEALLLFPQYIHLLHHFSLLFHPF